MTLRCTKRVWFSANQMARKLLTDQWEAPIGDGQPPRDTNQTPNKLEKVILEYKADVRNLKKTGIKCCCAWPANLIFKILANAIFLSFTFYDFGFF